MTVIQERPVKGSLRLETFNITTPGPFILDYSRLDVGTLGAGTENPEDQWTDWMPYLLQVTTRRGGAQDGITVKNDTGVLTARLVGLVIGSVGPIFLKGQRIRLRHISPLGVASDLYTGRILDVVGSLTLDKHGTPVPGIELTAVDNYVNHDQTTRYGAMPPTGAETFAQRIQRLTQTATAPIEPPAFDSDPLLTRTVYESSMANHLTLACNTVGAMWWIGVDGVTRFAERRFDAVNAITFAGILPAGASTDPTALHYIRPTASAGSAVFFNRALMHNHGAQIDPDSGDWVADDRDILTFNAGSIYGFSDAELDMNLADGWDAPELFYGWLVPTSNFTPKATSIIWNAQENLARIPDLEIGASVYLPTDTLDRDPWPWNQIIGISHTITPTRWMTELTLIGVKNP